MSGGCGCGGGTCVSERPNREVKAAGAGMVFQVSGLDCAEEVAILRAEVGPLVGGADNLAFDVLNGKMVVLAEDVATDAIIRAVARTGMKAQPWSSAGAPGQDQDGRRKLQAVLAGTGGAMTGLGYLLDTFGAGALPARVAFAAAILIGLWVVLPKALLAARRLRPDMNLLMTVAVIGAIGLGDCGLRGGCAWSGDSETSAAGVQ